MGCAVTTVRESFMLAVVMGRARNWRFGIAMIVLDTWTSVMLQ